MTNELYLAGRVAGVIDCCPDCGTYFLSATQRRKLAVSPDLDKVYDNLVKAVHEGERAQQADTRAMIQEQYASLRNGLKEGAGRLAVEVEFGTPNQTMLKNLQTNVAVFAAFKMHDMRQELVKGLRDSQGDLRSWSDFRAVAKPMVGNYRETFLQTEYDAAVRGSRMATVWQDIQKTRRVYPNIEYMVSRSANKREDHLALVGIVLPIDHPFWGAHFPPNGYKCKCSARPTDKQPTHAEDVPTADIDPAFAINPGKDGQVFEVSKHPYGQHPKAELKEAAKAAFGALCSYEKKEILNNARESGLMQKKIDVPKLPGPVQLNRTSYEKNLAYDHFFFEKLSVLHDIERVLQESTLLMVENKKEKQHVKQYHVLQHQASDGKRLNLKIEERNTGELYLYYIHIQK
jgi:hypothetical protein